MSTLTLTAGSYLATFPGAVMSINLNSSILDVDPDTLRSEKGFKKTGTSKAFGVDLSQILGSAVITTILEVTNTDLTISNILIDSGSKIILFTLSGGENNTEYVITVTCVTDTGQTIEVKVIILNAARIIHYYGTVFDADNYYEMYFQNNLDVHWALLTPAARLKALVQATRTIETLSFAGTKTDSDQPLQFPRDTETVIPIPIEHAAYEEALSLAQGTTADENSDERNILVERIDTAQVHYDRSWVQPNQQSGVISNTAWRLLQPYLYNPLTVALVRVN